MAVSEKQGSSLNLEGQQLLEALAVASGLPDEEAQKAIGTVLDHTRQSSDSLTIEELRAAMLQLLESVHQEVINEDSAVQKA